ncbi:nucleotide-binding universal stress UspA family protein [Haloactinopolyspora alba]|uniref:Nucleotide-binding universal stress UspA family protein n=1 Tax=Haloactinopolyspora alba TaxID=648780 RepID=A0A2P8E9H1_9ACTN|nr:universal stress protein [Haloactinopolyspora alba]PSL06095.1 nucleotide-binding universal stress UspA family protein [Haloactinopolyspora alba]
MTNTGDREEAGRTRSDPERTIVVGVDGSPAALNATHWAAREAQAHGDALRLVHAYPIQVYPVPHPVSGPDHAANVFRMTEDLLAARGYGDLEVSTVTEEGPAPQALLRHGSEGRMLVVGRSTQPPLATLFLGSTATASATHAHVPVTVVPTEWEPGNTPADVLLGVDGSKRSRSAVEYAFALAAARGTRVIAVHAVELPYGYPQAKPLRSDETVFEEYSSKVFSTALDAQRRAHPDVEVTTAVEYANPSNALAKHVESADVAVIGGRGHGVITGLLLGSAARSLLHRLPCPVTVVHEPREARKEEPATDS